MVEEQNKTLANVTIQNILGLFFNVKEHLSSKAILKATKWKIHDKNHCIIMLKWKPFKFTYLEDKLKFTDLNLNFIIAIYISL